MSRPDLIFCLSNSSIKSEFSIISPFSVYFSNSAFSAAFLVFSVFSRVLRVFRVFRVFCVFRVFRVFLSFFLLVFSVFSSVRKIGRTKQDVAKQKGTGDTIPKPWRHLSTPSESMTKLSVQIADCEAKK